MVLLIDNYDSFVYNLADYIGDAGWEPLVLRNDALLLEDIYAMAPSHVVLSPGPCTPLEAGICNDAIRHFAGRIPILGVCLGHQCIGHVFGGQIVRAPLPMHGKASLVYHDGRGVLAGLPSPLPGGRYHSLVIEPSSVPECLEVSARTEDGVIMGVRHRQYSVEGVQFHPESVLTPVEWGHRLVRNFLEVSECCRHPTT
ncbi:MAG: aminodeoxychorismate/anthranilate synthase component II [Chloroflexi bacterium]|nr:aminodeoxychorismate/anthranilate synthase component II [Chloroflexota bacterium]